MSTLVVKNVRRAFGPVEAVRGASLEVAGQSLHALLGPSGCGKTTMLRLIAGFDKPDAGTIHLEGEEISSPSAVLSPERRRIGMVFQDYHLFPHLDVRKNVAFGIPKAEERDRRVAEVLAMVGLSEQARSMPHELSGGQQQRVALARALAPRPRLLLMDEPFSNLDAKLRVRLRAEVRAILQQARITTILVTHDQEEALSTADHVSVMVEGLVAQTAPPKVMYFRPATEFVAGFVGEANFINGTACGRVVECAMGRVLIDREMHGAVRLLLRPESLQLSHATNGVLAPGAAQVLSAQFFGHDQLLLLRLPGGEEVLSRVGPEWQSRPGETVRISVRGVATAFEGRG